MADKVWVVQNLNSYEFIRTNWLHQFKAETKQGEMTWKGYLNWSEQSDVEELRRLVQAGRTADAWEHYDRLSLRILEEGNDLKIGEVTIHLVEAELNIGRLSKANKLIDSAEDRFIRDPHNHAVAMWLSGIVCWLQEDGSCWDAMHQWEACRNEFARLHASGPFGETRSEWYRQRLEEIRLFLDEMRKELSAAPGVSDPVAQSASVATGPAAGAAKTDSVPDQPAKQSKAPPPPDEGISPAEPPPDPGGKGPGMPPSSQGGYPKRGRRQPPTGNLRIFPVMSGSVQAGELRPIADAQLNYVEVNEVQIGQRKYSIVPLDDQDRLVNLLGVKRPDIIFILVQGTSMNDVPISDGDYIVVRRIEVDPFKDFTFTGKIVLADVFEDNVRKTNLKRLIYHSKKPYLLYVSADPEHKDGYVNKEIPMEKGWKIMGVVLARLTPLEDQEDSPE